MLGRGYLATCSHESCASSETRQIVAALPTRTILQETHLYREDKLKASLEFSRRRTNFHTSSHIIKIDRSKRNLLEWPLPANTDSMIQQISTISVIIPTAFLS
ncbi:hypothetical protein CGCF413_v005570 [Colletotrichum fructicola]|nr:hypothetical protein CGCF413_v005570 [Colletotrichum fructicola]